MHILGLLFFALFSIVIAFVAVMIFTLLRIVGKFKNFLNPFSNNAYKQSAASSAQHTQQSHKGFSYNNNAQSGNAHHEYSGQRTRTSKDKIFGKDEGEYVDFEEV